MKKWKCTVCGYIHTGDSPPENCPVCGAESDKFVEVDNSGNEIDSNDKKAVEGSNDIAPAALISFINGQIQKHHLHPISVHIPNGVIPVSFMFVVLAVIFNFSTLAQAAFYNLVFVVLSMPAVLFSGYVEWRNKYNGVLTKFFMIKIACGIIVTLLAVIIASWYIISPDITKPESSSRWMFLLTNLIMLGAAAIAGFIGGKLVFKD